MTAIALDTLIGNGLVSIDEVLARTETGSAGPHATHLGYPYSLVMPGVSGRLLERFAPTTSPGGTRASRRAVWALVTAIR